MSYTAYINTPGYLPTADEPALFGTVGEAWDYLATERREAEEDAGQTGSGYSATVNVLESLAESQDWSTCENAGVDPLEGTGTVYGPTPGYDGTHDLGLAYTVAETDDDQDEGA